MELRHLRYFTAVVQWKGYREASRHLHITQPSISEAVSDLESELGIQLFSRDGRVARLTPEGKAFYEEAIKTLAQAERSIAIAQRAARVLAHLLVALSATGVPANLSCRRPSAGNILPLQNHVGEQQRERDAHPHDSFGDGIA